jgi:hypothetical protein
MGTFKDANSEIDEDAVRVVNGIFRGPGWLATEPHKDRVGLDMSVDLLEDRHPQIRFYLQIKGMGPQTKKGKARKLISKAGTLNKPIELEHLDYWMKLPVPVFLVTVDVAEQAAYYVHMQRYVLEELKGDHWRDRLSAFKAARDGKRAATKPTKTIHISASNVLADTAAFRDAVRDASGYMASLSVKDGIAYQEDALRRLDERLDVRYIRTKDGEQFHIEARQPVELTMHVNLPRKKFKDLFGRGLVTSLGPGQLIVEGSPLWAKIASETTAAQLKQERRAAINIIRLDAAGAPAGHIDHLHCQVEGGSDEWRFTTQLPGNLVTIGFNLDLDAMRKHPVGSAPMRSTFSWRSNLPAFKATSIEDLGRLEHVAELFGGIADGDRYRFEVSLEEVGGFGGFTLYREAHPLLAAIGGVYMALDRAKTIAKHFQVSRSVPVTLTGKELDEIDFLYGLIQGRETPDPGRTDNITVTLNSEQLAAGLDAFCTPGPTTLFLGGPADFPFLGNPVHLDHCVRLIRNVKLITSKSDIKRRLKQPADAVKVDFATMPETEYTIKLADP